MQPSLQSPVPCRAASVRPLLVSHSGDAGGSNEVLLSLVRHRPEGCEPTCVFLAAGPTLAAVAELEIAVELVEAGRARHAWRAPGVVRRLRRIARESGADVVFAHVAKAHAYASIAARASRLPYLWWQHDLPLPTRSGRLAARLPADAVICSSVFTAARQRALGSAHVVCIHPGIELETELGGEPHAVSRDAPGTPVVGAVGRLRRYKRHELLLRAVPSILADEPSTRFVVLGGPTVDADYPDELRRLAAALGVENSVTFAGHVENAAAAMGGLDLVVHTAELEPFGLVVVEALAHGIPVVCPAEGGPAEIVRHGVDGLHVDVEDPAALAEAVLSLIRDPRRRAELGRAGRERIRERFSAARMAQEAWQLAADVAARRAVTA